MASSAPSQSGLNSKNGLKRINTSLSEASGSGPRSSGGGTSRLSLHIPNSYPRALTPRSADSNANTPVGSRPASPFGALKGAQSGADADAESERSCASSHASSSRPRIRVFRRDSSLITVQQIEDYNETVPSSDRASEVHLSSTSALGRLLQLIQALTSFFRTRETSSSSARDFLARERNFFVWLRLSCLLAILSASLILQLQLPDSAHSSEHGHRPRRRKRRADEPPADWDDLPVSSKAFAGIFFALSLLALGTGLADYLSAERQLEKEQVDFDETEGVFLNDGHTSRFVHGVMLVSGAGIIASALWLIAY